MHQAFKPKIYIIHVLFILMCPASAVPGRRPPSTFQLVCFIALKSIPPPPFEYNLWSVDRTRGFSH